MRTPHHLTLLLAAALLLQPIFLLMAWGPIERMRPSKAAVAVDHVAQFDWMQISVMLIGGLGFVALRRQRRNGQVIFLLVMMGVLLVSCVQVGPSPFYDYNRLDSVNGSVELIVPAESRPLHAQLSPDGRWLWIGHWYDEQQGYRYSLIDLVNDRLYEDLGQGSTARWLDNEHVMIGTQILRVTDMAQWKLQRIEPSTGSLGKLASAKHIYATDMDSSFYWLTTTDPALPYVIWSEFGASSGITNKQLEVFLADKSHTVITGTDFITGWTQPAYSPDRRYYIKVAPADPTPPGPENDMLLRAPYSAMFDTSTNQQVTHAYKWGWHGIFLGWAYDGSGAYFLYQPRGASGDLIYQKWPIYKVLVPGAQPRGTPAPATFTPASTFTPAPVSATPVGQIDSVRPVAFQSQSGTSGWYIDDVSVSDAATPTPTATPTSTPFAWQLHCQRRSPTMA
jgi:hypothetical protein